MMRWDTLNAYVDGELDAETRLAVAEALRRDPALSARVATLSRLKSVVRGAVVPERRRRPYGLTPAFACACLALLLGSGWLLSMSARPPADPARAAFAYWRALPAIPKPDATALREAAVPNLEPAGFQLVYLSPPTQGSGRLAGYAGRHGCRLGLWIATAADPAETRSKADAGLHTARLTLAGHTYVLLSEGMPAERFAALITAVAQRVRPDDPERLRVAMDLASGLGERPCTG